MHMHALAAEAPETRPCISPGPADRANLETHPEIQAKLAELQSRTIEYNRELMRITGELTEIRDRLSCARRTRDSNGPAIDFARIRSAAP